MSMNYCEENPVQGVLNWHCPHTVKIRKHPKDKRMQIEDTTCCWCGEESSTQTFRTHGPFHPDKSLEGSPKKKPKITLRKNRTRKAMVR